ncbi:MAG TPA: hypothetical protein VMF89_19605 [Polyangiales bacterium]|nr:hypothetical protein [Polyangiales bacterium]
MTELSPRARALIERSRASLRPTNVDRERIEAALQAKLSSQLAPTVEQATRGSWRMFARAGLGVCVVGVMAALVLVPEPQKPVSSTRVPPAAVVRPLPAPTPAAPVSELPAPTRLAPSPEPKASVKSPNAEDRLAIEVELLSHATRALRAGNANAALEALDQHQRRFPKGKLRQERRIAKARALCALGRVEEGRAELTDLPSAPAMVRAQKDCGL